MYMQRTSRHVLPLPAALLRPRRFSLSRFPFLPRKAPAALRLGRLKVTPQGTRLWLYFLPDFRLRLPLGLRLPRRRLLRRLRCSPAEHLLSCLPQPLRRRAVHAFDQPGAARLPCWLACRLKHPRVALDRRPKVPRGARPGLPVERLAGFEQRRFLVRQQRQRLRPILINATTGVPSPFTAGTSVMTKGAAPALLAADLV